MPTFLFLAAICLLVAASILLQTDASPKANAKLEKVPSGNAESTPVLTLQNRWAYSARDEKLAWDSAARDEKLELTEPAGLIVQFIGENSKHRSVRAKLPIPKGNSGIFYYEVTISGDGDAIYIGLATEQMPLRDTHVGYNEGTYGYGSSGKFWGHEVGGCSHWGNERPYIDGQPKFDRNNIIGCGVNLKTRQIIYTHNGRPLETTGLLVAESAAELYPCVSLFTSGNEIEANFGTKPFKFQHCRRHLENEKKTRGNYGDFVVERFSVFVFFSLC
uniref:Secreted SPRY domain-containing protein 15 n=2 Tax=Globodera rostochiensis TaxID=31243 RepID=I7A168_GLORO|nr:secreted SPRY domain-containing protein 15 [Globodera rostochiensis]